MKLSTLLFRILPFLWRLTRVRFIEGEGKFRAARAKLARIDAPDGYLALKDAYGARLASMAYAANVTFEGLGTHPPDKMLALISQLQTQRWYLAPTNDNERYAARYLDYLEAAVLGNSDRRDTIAKQLKQSPADRFFKDVLIVT